LPAAANTRLGRALDRPHVIAYLQQRTRKRLEILAAPRWRRQRRTWLAMLASP
jgi:hypothetical protein